MTRIEVKIRGRFIIGILPRERRKKQSVVARIRLEAEDFVDYAELAGLVRGALGRENFFYLEEGLDFLGRMIRVKFPSTKRLKIKLKKPEIIKNTEVCVSRRWDF